MKDSEALKAAVRQFWDNRPCGAKNTTAEPGTRAFYEEIEAHRYQEEFHIPLIAEFNDHSGERVLEIGCGLGTDGRRFVRGGANYVGCEFSLHSLVLARRGFELFGLPGAFVCADAENLPFQDAIFDLVYCHGVLHHTPDTERGIREICRVLRPGGKAVVMLYARESLSYVIGAQILGRLRLAWARLRMGRESFNRFVGLPPEHRGRLPDWVVINNSTDGLGNPLSKLYTARQLRQMFSAFRDVCLEKHYFPRRKVPVIGPLLPRSLAYWLGRMMGSFWYIKAVK